MNTGRQMLWLPTTREEKYKAKQTLDTFFVRIGDLLTAGLVFVGTQRLGLGIAGFGRANLVLVVLWLAVTGLVLRENHALVARQDVGPARSSGHDLERANVSAAEGP
jgi:AAA family ATP:ADP antiporter